MPAGSRVADPDRDLPQLIGAIRQNEGAHLHDRVIRHFFEIDVSAPVALSTSYQAMSAPPLMYATNRVGWAGASIIDIEPSLPLPFASFVDGDSPLHAASKTAIRSPRIPGAYAGPPTWR
jgi:hypothetical protein